MFKLRQKCNRRNAIRKDFTYNGTHPVKNTRPLAIKARDTAD